ncbi:hypothetical protein O8C96_04495 [Aliarcobacter butzleri]|uniref:portal protein n=1 Tax=Aliarcobacter butzleri TaxID=28197 RepID=UPI00263E65E7|nr:hypothetical protein [Aliarcobacter butzleri]MDN5044981.1 hypothetical protein [Aliarcobacter butzleri]
MIDEKDKSRLVEMITRSKAGLDSVMPHFIDLFNAYQALLDEKAIRYLDSKGKSRIPYYLIMTKLQRIHADFVEAYFTNKQFAKISNKKSLKGVYYDATTDSFVPFTRGLFDGMSINAINSLQNAIDFYTTEDDDDKSCLYDPLVKVLRQLQIYGTGIIKVYWDFESDGIVLEKIELKDISFDTEAVSFKDCKYLVHDMYLTKNEILEHRDSGLFASDAEYERINESNGTNTFNQNPNEFKRFKVQEIYEKQKGKWYVSTIWNKEIVLRFKAELPDGLPFIVGTLKEQEVKPDGSDNSVRVYGDSIVAPLIPIQREMIVIRNQQLDIIDRQLNPRYIINDNNINPFDFSNQKISAIRGNGEAVKELQTPNMRDSNFNVERLGVEAQEVIGVTDYSATGAKQMNKTATGMSILTSESSKILQHLLRGANETLIKPLFRKISYLVWSYGSAEFFWGIDRTQKLDYQVGVDVGLGATNKETALNGKTMAYSKILEMAGLKAQIGMNPQQDFIKAEKFLHQEIFPLLGIENYEEYGNEDAAETGNNPTNGNMEIYNPMFTRGQEAVNEQGGYEQSQQQPFYNGSN